MRYYGKCGYLITKETVDSLGNGTGVYTEELVERPYYGDITRLSSKWENGSGLNDNVIINNAISIVADPFAYENFPYLKYIEYMKTKWKIQSIEVQRPRLIITLGGIYNGQ